MNRLKLVVPEIKDLYYRKNILSDPYTMDYNKNLYLGFKEYDNETGCIEFPKSKWENWYKRWINNEPNRYYAYLVEKESQIEVGEVALRYDLEKETHIISIIIEDKHRGKGYGKEGLKLLLDKAFNDLKLEKVADNFPKSRIEAYNLFKQFGFEITERNNGEVFIELSKDKYLLIKK